MANLLKALADIGEIYMEDKKELRNEASKYDSLKVYLYNIETRTIEPNFNISSDKFIICRKGNGGNSPFLYPIAFLSGDKKKITESILKGNQTLLAFKKDEIDNNPILSILSKLNNSFFNYIGEEATKLPINEGEHAYVSLAYQGKPISEYFLDVYDNFLNNNASSSVYGYDILTNSKGVGADASLPFCSTNEMNKTMGKIEKLRILPLNSNSAEKLKLGLKILKDNISCDFFDMKLAIIPTLLNKNVELKEVVSILENSAKKNMKDIQKVEEVITITIDGFLEETAEAEQGFPIINTLMFYKKSKAAMNLYLTIDDVIPSYISYISNLLEQYKIRTFPIEKNVNNNKMPDDRIIALFPLFKNELDDKKKTRELDSKLQVMKFLLSRNKMKLYNMIERYVKLILKGDDQGFEWTKYFNGFYKDASMPIIERYQEFFNEADLLTEKINFKRRKIMNELTEDTIQALVKNNALIAGNSLLEAAYLLGLLSVAVVKWQQGVNRDSNSSFGRWLDRAGMINKDKLPNIFQKCEETIKKVRSQSGSDSKKVNLFKKCFLEQMSKAASEKNTVTKSSYVVLAFAMGGSDYDKTKEENIETQVDKGQSEKASVEQCVDCAPKTEHNLFTDLIY